MIGVFTGFCGNQGGGAVMVDCSWLLAVVMEMGWVFISVGRGEKI